MKLYTEDQLLNTVYAVLSYHHNNDGKVADERTKKHLRALTPIEFPTDEEIEEYLGLTGYYNISTSECREGIKQGIGWIKEYLTTQISPLKD